MSLMRRPGFKIFTMTQLLALNAALIVAIHRGKVFMMSFLMEPHLQISTQNVAR